MAEKISYRYPKRKQPWEQDDLAAALDSVIGKKGYNSTTAFAGDENIDWTAFARGPLTNVGAGQGTVQKIQPPDTGVTAQSSAVPRANTIRLNTGTSKVSAGLYSGGNQPSADTIVTDSQAANSAMPEWLKGPGPTRDSSSTYSPVDRSGFNTRAQTIANLQNDPKILALKQKIASLKAGSEEQISAINKAYEDIIPLIVRNLEAQKQRTTDIYNQRGLYGSGMETGKLVQAEQEAAKAQSSAKQAQAEEIAAIMRNLGMLESQTNEQIAQLEGQKGDIISQIVAELEAQADAEDQRRREAAAAAAQEAARYIDQLRQQDWTNQMREREFNADQYWRQQNYNLDAARLAQQQAEERARAAYESASPTEQAIMDFSEFDNPTDAVSAWLAQRDALANSGINIWDVWNTIAEKWGIPATSRYGLTPEEVLRRLRAGQTWR